MTETTASAIFGDKSGGNSEEPVSGEQGAGTVNEPFDKGNIETSADKMSNQSSEPSGPSNAVGTEATGDPNSAQQPSQEQQGSDRPEEEPSINDGMPHSDEDRERLMQQGTFPHDPNDHSGEPLKVHDGSDKKNDSDENDVPDDSHKAQGSGEQYVKSAGLKADGGDFDAANPGAGSEANRLLEEKGIHQACDDHQDVSALDAKETSGSDGIKDKVHEKIFKIKEKLHIGHHNKAEE